MNMLVGVVCQVVSAAAETEGDALKMSFVHEKMRKLLCETGFDKNNDQTISKEDFVDLLLNPKATAILQDAGVDVIGLVDFKDLLFEQDEHNYADDHADGDIPVTQTKRKELTFSELMHLVLNLRGGNTATVRDIMNLRKSINVQFSAIERKFVRSSRSAPTTPPHSTWQSIPADLDVESTSDSGNPCSSSTKLESLPELKDLFHSLQGMLSTHEVQVAALEFENGQLKEQVAQMAHDARKPLLSEAHTTFCSELHVTPNPATAMPPRFIPPPEDPARLLSSSAPRIHLRRDVDTGTANTVADNEGATGRSTSLRTQILPHERRDLLQSGGCPRCL